MCWLHAIRNNARTPLPPEKFRFAPETGAFVLFSDPLGRPRAKDTVGSLSDGLSLA